MCVLRELGRPQYLPQTSHLYPFLLEWTLTDVRSEEIDCVGLDGPTPCSTCWRGWEWEEKESREADPVEIREMGMLLSCT
jgi:hypothetical protein